MIDLGTYSVAAILDRESRDMLQRVVDRAMGKEVVTGQHNFAQDELDYIAPNSTKFACTCSVNTPSAPTAFRDAIQARLGRRAEPAKIGRPAKKTPAPGAEESAH